jgi:antitoxin component of MazEF toxin-antitoxin module
VKAIQKICKHGNGWSVTLPRFMMQVMGIRPGDFVEFVFHEAGDITMKVRGDLSGVMSQSPGVLPPETPVVPR